MRASRFILCILIFWLIGAWGLNNLDRTGEFTISRNGVKCVIEYSTFNDSICIESLNIFNLSNRPIGFADYWLFMLNEPYDGLLFGLGIQQIDPLFKSEVPNSLISLIEIPPGGTYSLSIDKTALLSDLLPMSFTFDYIEVRKKYNTEYFDPDKYWKRMKILHFGLD